MKRHIKLFLPILLVFNIGCSKYSELNMKRKDTEMINVYHPPAKKQKTENILASNKLTLQNSNNANINNSKKEKVKEENDLIKFSLKKPKEVKPAVNNKLALQNPNNVNLNNNKDNKCELLEEKEEEKDEEEDEDIDLDALVKVNLDYGISDIKHLTIGRFEFVFVPEHHEQFNKRINDYVINLMNDISKKNILLYEFNIKKAKTYEVAEKNKNKNLCYLLENICNKENIIYNDFRDSFAFEAGKFIEGKGEEEAFIDILYEGGVMEGGKKTLYPFTDGAIKYTKSLFINMTKNFKQYYDNKKDNFDKYYINYLKTNLQKPNGKKKKKEVKKISVPDFLNIRNFETKFINELLTNFKNQYKSTMEAFQELSAQKDMTKRVKKFYDLNMLDIPGDTLLCLNDCYCMSEIFYNNDFIPEHDKIIYLGGGYHIKNILECYKKVMEKWGLK